MVARLSVLWGVLGVCALLLFALLRLFPYAVGLLEENLSVLHLIVLIVFIVFMAYTEGYKGFQKAFSPRVVMRAKYLLRNDAKWYWRLLAPLFCMSYFAAPVSRRIVSYALSLMIVFFVLFMRYIDQPWRGILDAGVVVGLSWGLCSVLYCCWLGCVGKLDYPADVEHH